jgi:adenylate kinase family enzyme
MRIHIIGLPGAGKTTLALRLAGTASYRHVELDQLYWGQDWTPTPDWVFRGRTAQALHGNRWIVDGSYDEVREIVWLRTQMVLWLDYRPALVFWRLGWRTVRNLVTQRELWASGNRQTINEAISPNSLLARTIKSCRQKRLKFAAWMNEPTYRHIDFIRLTAPCQAEQWLSGFRCGQMLAYAL